MLFHRTKKFTKMKLLVQVNITLLQLFSRQSKAGICKTEKKQAL